MVKLSVCNKITIELVATVSVATSSIVILLPHLPSYVLTDPELVHKKVAATYLTDDANLGHHTLLPHNPRTPGISRRCQKDIGPLAEERKTNFKGVRVALMVRVSD